MTTRSLVQEPCPICGTTDSSIMRMSTDWRCFNSFQCHGRAAIREGAVKTETVFVPSDLASTETLTLTKETMAVLEAASALCVQDSMPGSSIPGEYRGRWSTLFKALQNFKKNPSKAIFEEKRLSNKRIHSLECALRGFIAGEGYHARQLDRAKELLHQDECFVEPGADLCGACSRYTGGCTRYHRSAKIV